MIKKIISTIAALLLMACSQTGVITPKKVAISDKQNINLPYPASFGRDFAVNQLVIVQYNGAKAQQLPVYLELTDTNLVIAAFSSFGTRIMALDYNGESINTDIIQGLEAKLPAASQILLNLMLTLWPQDVWQQELRKIGWSMQTDGLERIIYNNKHQIEIKILYTDKNMFKGNIIFLHKRLNFKLVIKNLNSDN